MLDRQLKMLWPRGEVTYYTAQKLRATSAEGEVGTGPTVTGTEAPGAFWNS